MYINKTQLHPNRERERCEGYIERELKGEA